MKPRDFLGQWTLKRRVFDADRRPIGGMWGTVLFEPIDESSLSYQERVWNQTGESSHFLARQSYLYLFNQKAVEIHRGKEKQSAPFLTLPHGKTVVDGHYICRPDLYTLRWVWVNPHLFYTRFSVKGLRKDYTLETLFRR